MTAIQIAATHCRKEDRVVHHAAGHGAGGVQGARQRNDAAGTQQTHSGFEAHEGAFSGGGEDGARGFGADGRHGKIGRHSHAAARAGASGVVDPASVGIERLTAHRAEPVGPARKQVIGPFAQVGFAQDDASLRLEPLDDFGIVHHVVLQQPGTCRGGHSRHVHIVLDQDRHSVDGVVRVGTLFVPLAGFLNRRRVDGDDRIEHRIWVVLVEGNPV